ncbi:PTS glucitol/sorbitol transporter subunit IIA [Staphylococcus succinus]|uniref:PTS glucitol/sorbitol transporter subunit IIA n=1 Tax=Staphylococcus succinus TaxID=61015 RepID=UPI002DB7C1D5|nr:PTS glucitol/sorbitol transporter subunit IIA [Staphylococcus succinus]MEB7463139.1 PTS glucitol/sorbitol transporter subunit IIA [Staphylococcus succinus]
MYKTIVKEIGQDAKAFEEEKMVILFGDNAPDELVDYCYIIDINAVEGTITEKQKLYIDHHVFDIMKVGSAVQDNLSNLGHITLKFDGSNTADQSGTLYLEDADIPEMTKGTELKIQ